VHRAGPEASASADAEIAARTSESAGPGAAVLDDKGDAIASIQNCVI
jgi:hypothetical protein